MQIVYDLFVIIGVVSLFLMKRPPVATSLAFGAHVIYSSPLIFGYLVEPSSKEPVNIHLMSYLIMLLPLMVVVTLIVYAFFYKKNQMRNLF